MDKSKFKTCEELHHHRFKLYHPKRLPAGGWLIHGMEVGPVHIITAILFAAQHSTSPEELEFLFWEFARHTFNSDPNDQKFIKNKWSWKIIHELSRERWLAIGGAASSGKSWCCAAWAIFRFMCDPANTIVLVTSTDIKGAKKRIYGAIKQLLHAVPDAPVKAKDSLGMICYYDGHKQFEDRGIQIVTADKSQDAQKMGKLVGAKAKNVILIADEHDEMGFNVTAAAKGNLSKNQFFQMVSLFNPGSRFSPGGEFAEPVGGWNSLDIQVEREWKTKMKGKFIRLISEESPNVDLTPDLEYPVGEYVPGVVTQDHIDDDLEVPGVSPEEVRKSRNFLRFHAAVFYDGDDADSVYTEAEIMRARATEKVELKNTTRVMGVDPSYSDGGDNTVAVICDEGWDTAGQHCVQIVAIEYLVEDTTDKVNPRTLQIADKIKALCAKYKVSYENLGIDASSGSGTGICDMLRLQIDSNSFLRVQFGGAASDKRISTSSKITGKQRYKNRATELFMQGKMYLTGNQLYCIPNIIIQQITKRNLLEPTKGEHGLMFQVEPKKSYKSRTGKSPDEADAFFVAVETARVRRMFTPRDPVKGAKEGNNARWLNSPRTHASFSDNAMGFVGNL